MYFQDIRPALERIYEVRSEQLVAFYARLKNIQKLGWPNGSNTGTGKRADYSQRMVRELVFVLELCVLGIRPERAIELVKANLPLLHKVADGEGVIDLPCTPYFGERMPASSIKLDMRRALEIIRQALP